MSLPYDYLERTYAGVLGKLIGVYLGRPFEGWSYDRIMAELGEIQYYVHERRDVPLIVTDDDISGTFTFLRALNDHGPRADLTAEEIGKTWLNYIIENRTILWWGGLGNSTEHTAFLRLKQGIPAPRSGSAALNTRTVAEQIGAQIFIDGWAMVAPGDPERAAALAGEAARVSHDGEAVYGAQVIAAREALAYVEPSLDQLIDVALTLIPADSIIRRLIDDLREWHAELHDWRDARLKIVENYGYDKYGGNCHMIPNHALIHLALLYGGDDFQKALMIVNTAGWDTDCNSGNVGCLLGIKNGLAGIETGPDWRGPVADRLYLPTADGGRAITDAATETYHIVNLGRALHDLPPLQPKAGSRFHFELPGSVQGFEADTDVTAKGTLALENVAGFSAAGTRSLALRYRQLAPGRCARAFTPTFTPPDSLQMPGYTMLASPTLYPGQTLRAAFSADPANSSPVDCRLCIRIYAANDQPLTLYGPISSIEPGARLEAAWPIPHTGGAPIFHVGLEISTTDRRADGTLYLDYLTWDGEPQVVLGRPDFAGKLWRSAWVDGVDSFTTFSKETFRVMQNHGTGLLMQGGSDWRDYTVRAGITPHLLEAGGIAARVGGMRRYYALLLIRPGKARLIKMRDVETVLAEVDFDWQPETAYQLELRVNGNHISGRIDDQITLEAVDESGAPLTGGGVALVITEGRMAADQVAVSG